MGLEGVELVLAVEHEFQIVITDEEAVSATTPAKLTDIVYSKLQHAEDSICISQHGFYKVRRYLMEKCGISRNSIKPDTLLIELFSINDRKKYWKIILSELSVGQTISAPLDRPRSLELIIYLLPFILLIPFSFYFGFKISILISLGMMFSLLLVTIPMKVEFPRDFRTVSDLVRICGTLQPQKRNRDEVYLQVRKIISDVLGIEEEKIMPNSDFVKDLGL